MNADKSLKIATATQLEGPARVSKKPTVEAKVKEPTAVKASTTKTGRSKGDAKVTVEGSLTIVECEPATVKTLGTEASPPVDKSKAKGKVIFQRKPSVSADGQLPWSVPLESMVYPS